MSYINKPELYEFVYLKPGEQKIVYTKDTKMPNTGCFQVLKEGHTFGNLITTELLNEKNIVFVGYKVPHPLKSDILIKIRTTPKYSPEKAFLKGLRNIKKKVESLESSYEAELKRFREKSFDKNSVGRHFPGETPYLKRD